MTTVAKTKRARKKSEKSVEKPKSKTWTERLVVDMNIICNGDGSLPVVDYNDFESTIGDMNLWNIGMQAADCFERGDDDEGDRLLSTAPLAPHIAFGMLYEKDMTEKELRSFNLADAEAYFGKDWIERYRPASLK